MLPYPLLSESAICKVLWSIKLSLAVKSVRLVLVYLSGTTAGTSLHCNKQTRSFPTLNP